MSLDGESVNRAARNIQVGVGRAEHKQQDAAIQEARESLDAGYLDGDDERRGGGRCVTFSGGDEKFAVVGDDESQKEDRADIEDENAPERELDGARNLIVMLEAHSYVVVGLIHTLRRGFCASPTVTPINSVPRNAKTAVTMLDQTARKRPSEP